MSPEYAAQYFSPKWQKKKAEVYDRDSWTCQDCGSTTKTLHAHHCYRAKGAPYETPNDCLITVCEECHPIREAHERALRKSLGRALRIMPIPQRIVLEILLDEYTAKGGFDSFLYLLLARIQSDIRQGQVRSGETPFDEMWYADPEESEKGEHA